jgi:uncharacterized protein DUF1259
MNTVKSAVAALAVTVLPVAIVVAAPAFAAEPDWNQVAQALGKSGGVQAGGVYRVGFPRTDLKVTLDGVALRPGFALGGWVAFQPMGTETMVMGDLVLTQDEVTRSCASCRKAASRRRRCTTICCAPTR